MSGGRSVHCTGSGQVDHRGMADCRSSTVNRSGVGDGRSSRSTRWRDCGCHTSGRDDERKESEESEHCGLRMDGSERTSGMICEILERRGSCVGNCACSAVVLYLKLEFVSERQVILGLGCQDLHYSPQCH